MKQVNSYYRRCGTCEGYPGMSEDVARKFDARVEKAHSWDKQPYPAYLLQKNNGNINRVRERIEELETLKITPENGEYLPDKELTGEKVKTPRGNFSVTDMSVEAMKRAGYGFHHEHNGYYIMGNGNRAFAVKVEPQLLKGIEKSPLRKEEKSVFEPSL